MSTDNLSLDLSIVPDKESRNFLFFFDKIKNDFIASRILKELDIYRNEKSYYTYIFNNTSNQILKEKIKLKTSGEEDFLNDEPKFNSHDLFTYLILIGCPFVEKEKQERFKVYLTTKTALTDYAELVKEIIFPYQDSDKSKLEPNSFVILKFASVEHARIVRDKLDKTMLTKNNQANVFMFDEFLQILFANDNTKLELLKAKEYENVLQNEYFAIRNKTGVVYYGYHYLKKELNLICNFGIEDNDILKWSPNGTFLVKKSPSKLEFYTLDNSLNKIFEIPDNCIQYLVSPNEKYLVTYLGKSNTNLISDYTYVKDMITRQNVFIWDLSLKAMKKSIKISSDETFDNTKFSNDGKFLSRLKDDVLIIYEAPEFKMLKNSEGRGLPLTDKVTKYTWFPYNNYLMCINEQRKDKHINTIIDFYEIPTRIKCSFSVSISNIQVINYSWHPNGKTLLLLLKTVNSPNWSIKVVDFNLKNFTHKSSSYDVVTPVKSNNKDLEKTEKDIDFYEVDAFWADDGNDILISAKKRLLIPNYSKEEAKYKVSDDGYSITISMYSIKGKELTILPWEKNFQIKDKKYDSICVSPNRKHFIIYNKQLDTKSIYGEGILYCVDKKNIHEVTPLTFGEHFSTVTFDPTGRFFYAENTKFSEKERNQVVIIYYMSGESVTKIEHDSIRNVSF